ncbi:MAG: ABC transporter substrate-binding protein, partial [Deltaproteobacteria bacterium]|nr:ABC transporter substrate-binding protein [Deltaproteobacteria bacterium]
MTRKEEKRRKMNGCKRRWHLSTSPGFIFALLLFIVPASLTYAGTVNYQDKLGRTVILSVPVKRAVLFETYELTAALGVLDRIAGISRYANENDLMLAVKPDIAKTIPAAGSGGDVNIEALLRLRPDLVLTWTFKPETVRFM